MAKVHVLKQSGGKQSVLVHFLTPGGNNSAGVPWKTAALEAGVIGTAHPDGDPAEAAGIEAGDVVELVETISVNVEGLDPAEITAAVDAEADAAIAKWLKDQTAALAYYGYTQGTVS